VTRAGATAADLAVHYTVSGSASASDRNPLSGSVTIPAGQASAIITITPIDDTAIEGNETVVVTLEAGADYTVGALASATVTIADNDTAAQTVSISASDPDAAEAALNPGVLTVTRSGSSAASLTIYYTVGGTATAGSDFTALSGSITIAAGQTSATISILPVDDTAVEGSESVTLTLSADPSYSVDANGSATVTIADDDTSSAPSWSRYLPLMRR